MGILGGFSGRVGTVVGYYRRGGWYVRAYQPHIKDRRSELQLQQRSRFKQMILFASQATPVLRVGLRAKARGMGLTEGNLFLRMNHVCFARGGGSEGVDYARLCFSKGGLAAPRASYYTVSEGGVITVGWSADGGGLDDRVEVFVYCPAVQRGVSLGGNRVGRRVQALLPDGFAGEELHVWVFAVGGGGMVSCSEYAERRVAAKVGLVEEVPGEVPGEGEALARVVRQEEVGGVLLPEGIDVAGFDADGGSFDLEVDEDVSP